MRPRHEQECIFFRARSIVAPLVRAPHMIAGAALVLAGCSRDASTREPITADTAGLSASTASPTASASSGDNAFLPSAATRGEATHVVRATVAKLAIEIALPSGWQLLAAQSDMNEGLIAFGPDGPNAENATAFVDASLVVRVPASLADATTEARKRDVCAKPSACVVLGSETLPDGYLVSLRTPEAVAVESWLRGPADRAVRCGFEMSALHAPTPWLADPSAVAHARAEGESLCKSVKATP